MAVVAEWYIASALHVFFICYPFKPNWNPEVPSVCGNRPAAYMIIVAANFIADFVILLIFMPFVVQLFVLTISRWKCLGLGN